MITTPRGNGGGMKQWRYYLAMAALFLFAPVFNWLLEVDDAIGDPVLWHYPEDDEQEERLAA